MSTPLQLPADPPAPIRRALDLRDARASDLAAVRQELHAARTAAEAAVAQDRHAYAAARDRGKADPGPAREQAAQAKVADLERRETGEAQRLQQAEDELRAAVSDHVDVWTVNVTKTWAKADAELKRVLEKVAQVEERGRAIRAAAAWLAEVQQSGGSLDRPLRTVGRLDGTGRCPFCGRPPERYGTGGRTGRVHRPDVGARV